MSTLENRRPSADSRRTPVVRAPIPVRWEASETEFGILNISGQRARLLLVRGAHLVEVANSWLPVVATSATSARPGHLEPRAQLDAARLSYASRVLAALRATTRDDLPIVVAGDPTWIAPFLKVAARRGNILGVIPGDHVHTSPRVLRVRGRQLLRRAHASAGRSG